MHMAWEMTAWLDKYVKNAQPPEKREQALKLWESGQSVTSNE